jgi:hypothetical protein
VSAGVKGTVLVPMCREIAEELITVIARKGGVFSGYCKGR